MNLLQRIPISRRLVNDFDNKFYELMMNFLFTLEMIPLSRKPKLEEITKDRKFSEIEEEIFIFCYISESFVWIDFHMASLIVMWKTFKMNKRW